MPHYRKHSKMLMPITEQEFIDGMENGKFVRELHKAYCVCLYYFGVRNAELIRAKKEQFFKRGHRIYFDVGKRLKGGLHTVPIFIREDKPYAYLILEAVSKTKGKKRVFPFTVRTGWNIVDRAFNAYPHFFRLSKITNFLKQDFKLIEVKSWTGHKSLSALDSYAGIVDIEKMGEA